MAPLNPGQVLAALRGVSDDNDNPLVWRTIADAVIALPADAANSLGSKFAKPLELEIATRISLSVVEAAVSLAERGQPAAFQLANDLLRPAADNFPERGTMSEAEYAELIRGRRRDAFWRDAWTLPRLDEYALSQVAGKLLPLLEKQDAGRTLGLLIRALDATSKLVPRVAARLEETLRLLVPSEEQDHTIPSVDPEDIDSRHWCTSLVDSDIIDSRRALLARHCFACAQRLAASEQGPGREPVLRRLEGRNNEIFRRMVLALLAEATAVDTDLQARIDAFVASGEAIAPPFGAVETGRLLRSHFANASTGSQEAFRESVARGPGEAYLNRTLEFDQRYGGEQSRDEIIAGWQRRRLRRFHDKIPPILAGMARSLDVEPTIPTAEQQALDEVGFYGRMSSRVRYQSPISADELRAQSPMEMAHFLSNWQPDPETGDASNAPSETGLLIEIRTLAAHRPDSIADSAKAITASSLPLGRLAAILEGVKAAVQTKRKFSIAAVAEIARHTWNEAARAPRETKGQVSAAQSCARAALDFVVAVAGEGETSRTERDILWPFVALIANSEFCWWSEQGAGFSTFQEALHGSESHISSHLVRAVFGLAWAEFIEDHRGIHWPPPERTAAGDRATAILDGIVDRSGHAAACARAAIGVQLIDSFWFAHGWIAARLPALLDRFDSPSTHPTWAIYLARSQVFRPILSHIRQWYGEFAEWLPENGSPPAQDPNWSLAEPFAMHITWACLQEAWPEDEADRVLTSAFGRLPVKARVRAYWSVMSSFSRSDAVDQSLSSWAIWFWKSRLTQLEQLAPSDARDEEAEGLVQLIAAKHLPDRDVMECATRTTILLRKKHRVLSTAWSRLRELSSIDAAATFPIIERLIDCAIGSEVPYVAFDDVAQPIRDTIAQGGLLRGRALSLVHRIGDAGFTEFDVLWREAQRAD